MLRRTLTVGLALMMSAKAAAAEKQFKPFIAVTFAGKTTFVDLEEAAGDAHVTFGAGGTILWDVFGAEVDIARARGFFQSGNRSLVVSSGVTTVTGNVVVTLPRRMTEYSLRPYFVGGGGLMRVHIADAFRALQVSETLAAIDLGGGATGFISNRLGVCWELRYFRSFGGDVQPSGISFGPEQLSFWRANMALVIRY